MQAIITRYMPPTDTKPSRIKASCARGSIIVSYPHELSGEDVHRFAVTSLCHKFALADQKEYGTPLDGNPWNRPFVTGHLPSGDHAHVFTSEKTAQL